jgi:hypothetical protein
MVASSDLGSGEYRVGVFAEDVTTAVHTLARLWDGGTGIDWGRRGHQEMGYLCGNEGGGVEEFSQVRRSLRCQFAPSTRNKVRTFARRNAQI